MMIYVIILLILIGGIGAFIINNLTNMEPNQRTKVSGKDFFLNLGAIVALYTTVISLVTLLFTVINHAYPRVTSGYSYYGSGSISWSVATLIIFFPILITLMWLLEKQYRVEPERKNGGIHRWLTYITLFITGLVIAGDLITVLYYFIDGQELTTGFLLKVLVLLVVASSLFIYFISDLRDKLTSNSRKAWRVFAAVMVIGSIVWGFSVLGSPRNQRLYKYDEQKLNDLMNVTGSIQSYYSTKGVLPKDFMELSTLNYYINSVDPQNGKTYEYSVKTPTTFEVCAEFNKASNENANTSRPEYPYGGTSWTHPVGRHCFEQAVNPNMYPPTKPIPAL